MKCNAKNPNCSFINDSGFQITINGTYPNPSSIDASTLKDLPRQQPIDIGKGPYEVSELLFDSILGPKQDVINFINNPESPLFGAVQ